MFDFLKTHCLIFCELSDVFQTLSTWLNDTELLREDKGKIFVNKLKYQCMDALYMDGTHLMSSPCTDYFNN